MSRAAGPMTGQEICRTRCVAGLAEVPGAGAPGSKDRGDAAPPRRRDVAGRLDPWFLVPGYFRGLICPGGS